MAAVIALALIVDNKFIVFPFCGIVLIRGILVRQGIAIGTKVGPIFRVRSGAALPGAVGRLGLLLAGGLIVVHILAPSMAQSRMLFCIGLVKVLLVAAIPFADLIPLAGGGASGGFNDPLCTLKIVVQGRVLCCISLVKVLLVAAIPFADLIPLAGGGAGRIFSHPLCTLKIMAQGRDGRGLCLGAL